MWMRVLSLYTVLEDSHGMLSTGGASSKPAQYTDTQEP